MTVLVDGDGRVLLLLELLVVLLLLVVLGLLLLLLLDVVLRDIYVLALDGLFVGVLCHGWR